jgi:hypothetical protein
VKADVKIDLLHLGKAMETDSDPVISIKLKHSQKI